MPFRYAYPIDHLIQAFKYGGQAHCGRVLGGLLARHLHSSREGSWPQLVLPVPLATQRYRQRGFNQAIELASALRSIEGMVVRADVIARTRETLEQASLDRKARRRNVRHAFELTQPMYARHVAIVDDVVTTGSTASEIARLLRRAGAQRVEIWAIARALPAMGVSGK
jgi:ComF family protein